MALADDRRSADDRAVEACVQGKGATNFHQAARVWAADQGEPVSWPEWQKAMRVLRHLFSDTAPEARSESLNSELSELRKLVMQEIHGPDWSRHQRICREP